MLKQEMHIIYFIMRKWHCNTVNEKKKHFSFLLESIELEK